MSDVKKIGWVRKTFGAVLFGFGCCCLLVLDQVDIVMNASESLDEPAFLLIEHPVFLGKHAVVAAKMPDVLQPKFGDENLYVKRIGGIPGDVITLDHLGNPCIADFECFPLQIKNGKPISSAIPPGVIPADHFAVFGTSEDSLDSRYEAIGLIHKDDLVGRGVAVPWATDWRK